MSQTILFVCPHSAAKSVIAAAYFQQLMPEFQVKIGGTEPDDQLAPHVVSKLREEGIDVSHFQPRLVTAEDVAAADRIVSLGCTPKSLGVTPSEVNLWDDVPPPSKDIQGACERIRLHVEQLVQEVQAKTD